MYALRVFALLIVVATAHGAFNTYSRLAIEAQISAHKKGLLGRVSKAYQRRYISNGLAEVNRAKEAKRLAEEKRAAEVQRVQRIAEEQRAAEAAAPKRYYYESTLTWDSSAGFCDRFNRSLCSYEELCPDTGNGGKQLIHDVVVGDHWLATKGRDWLQVGNSHGHPCVSLNGLQWAEADTKWTDIAESKPWKGYVCCCIDTSPEPEPAVVLRFIGTTATYDSSRDYCVHEGRRLCTSSEICVDDKPVYGGTYGDHWVASSDHENDWMQIGTSNAPICGHHNGYPEWGKRTDNSSKNFVGYAYCCK